MTFFRFRTVGILFSALALGACDSGDRATRSPDLPADTLNSITITCNPTTIAVGLTGQCTASCTYNKVNSDGSVTVTPPSTCDGLQWSSGNPNIVSIDGGGTYTGVSPGGPVNVSGCVDGTCDSVPITVRAACPVAGVAPDIQPAMQSLPEGLRSQLQTFVTFEDGGTVNVAQQPGMNWSSANPGIASICNTQGGCGLNNGKGTVTAVEVGGPVTITGTYTQPDCDPIPPGTATVEVTDAILIPGGLCVEPVTVAEPDFTGCRPDSGACTTVADLSVPIGGMQEFRARGRFTDGQECSLTETAEWSSSNTGAVTVNNTDEKGKATGVAAGTANVIATVDDGTGDKTGQHPLTVVVGLVLASNSLEVGVPIDSNRDGAINDADELAKFFCVGYADIVGGLADSEDLSGAQQLQSKARFCPQSALRPDGSCDPAQLQPALDVTNASSWVVPNSFWDGQQCSPTAIGDPAGNEFPAQVGDSAGPPSNKGLVTPRGSVRVGTACIQADFVNPTVPTNSDFDGATALVLPITNDVLLQDDQIERAVELCNTLAPLFLLGGDNGGAGGITQLLAALSEIINPILTGLTQGNEPGGLIPTDDIIDQLIEGLSDNLTAQLFEAGLQDVVDAVNDGVYEPLNCALGALLNAIATQDPDAAQAIQSCPPEGGGLPLP